MSLNTQEAPCLWTGRVFALKHQVFHSVHPGDCGSGDSGEYPSAVVQLVPTTDITRPELQMNVREDFAIWTLMIIALESQFYV